MSNNKMLIDASHPEETRVVVLRNNRIEEFDFEAADKKPLRGNIYLAKVTRVEPSLQAAFVEYGGNRHGFLAFSEIHPDYYQIPVADRLALLEDEAREQREEAAEEDKRSSRRSNGRRRRGGRNATRSSKRDDSVSADADGDETTAENAAENAGNPDLQSATGDGDVAPGNENQQTPEQADSPQVESSSAEISSTEISSTEISSTEASPPEFNITAGFGSGDEWTDPAAGPEAGTTPATSENPAPNENPETSTDEPVIADASAQAEPENVNSEAALPEAEITEDTSTGDGGEKLAAEASPADDAEGDSDASDDDGESAGDDDEDDDVEQLGGESEEDIQPPPRRSRRQYKIQEVIKRRQIMLIQVVKEERGNKGAALTTYLSLAGRYSVLMPNTARGGGISRKITDGEDRRRLKGIVQDLEVPDGMGVILRTAGASRTNQEVRRDFEYLLRLWESVREMTLHSSAPTLVYEEGSLVKRSIRDLYGKEVDEVVVSGEEGYREAKDFMRMLMPSHARNVKSWREPQPMFAKSGVEPQLDSLFSPNVTLKSGGYIVINQTEALVAIDVNSGRSTREHNIEDTALRTNLEAADEVARQLRLRDLAGLIVVDFIDMEEHRNNRSVERRMKDALKSDRARIQVGRISHFGLLEMSRQRMRTGVLEGSSIVCPHCQGSGNVRSTASIALHVLRLIEEALLRNNNFDLIVRTRSEVALYILNQKRATLMELESRFGVALTINADDGMTGTTYHSIERGEPAAAPVPPSTQALQFSSPVDDDADQDEQAADVEASEDTATGSENEDTGEQHTSRSRGGARRNRGGRSRRRDKDSENEEAGVSANPDAENSADSSEPNANDNGENEDGQKRKRRRRRRGRNDRPSSGISAEAPQPSDDGLAAVSSAVSGSEQPVSESTETSRDNSDEATAATGDAGEASNGQEEAATRRSRGRRGSFRGRRRSGAASSSEDASATDNQTDPAESSQPSDDSGATYRSGTWIKSTDQAEASDAPVKTYPFSSPREDASPQVNNEATAVGSAPEDAPKADNDKPPASEVASAEAAPVEPASAEPAPDQTEPVAPAIETQAESNGHAEDVSTAQENGGEAPAREPRLPDVLPEAPPPTVKKSGWWSR